MTHFYTKEYNEFLSPSTIFPCFVLIPDGWNDFGYYTLFNLVYYINRNDSEEIGAIKILDIENIHTKLPKKFNQLKTNLFSLGQSLEFYEKIKKISEDQFEDTLKRLNDISINNDLFELIENNQGFSNSLIRFGAAEKALKESRLLLYENKRRVNDNLMFNYKTKVEGAESPHKVTFDFRVNEDLPYRMNVLIGKNGTGKTQLLCSMVNSISGVDKRNKFSPYNPLFNKIIAISYGLFDDFPKPEDTTVFSYKYIGLRTTSEEIISDERLEQKLRNALSSILQDDRTEIWFESVGRIIHLSYLGLEKNSDLTIEWINNLSYKNAKRLSSGQSITLFILSELIANIQYDSLILFDEPETHLHPSALSQLINSFHGILANFRSFAIICTHSPLIIQDIPSRYITIFDRQGNYPIIRKLPLESFGANISLLTSNLFETISNKELYKTFLDEMAYRSIDSVDNLFENGLSMNAHLYLTALKNRNRHEKP